MHPPFVPRSPDYIKDGAKRARTNAQDYMNEARKLATIYPNSRIVREHLREMEDTLGQLIENTTDKKIEEAVKEVFSTHQ